VSVRIYGLVSTKFTTNATLLGADATQHKVSIANGKSIKVQFASFTPLKPCNARRLHDTGDRIKLPDCKLFF